jgi:hypothetical protein
MTLETDIELVKRSNKSFFNLKVSAHPNLAMVTSGEVNHLWGVWMTAKLRVEYRTTKTKYYG